MPVARTASPQEDREMTNAPVVEGKPVPEQMDHGELDMEVGA